MHSLGIVIRTSMLLTNEVIYVVVFLEEGDNNIMDGVDIPKTLSVIVLWLDTLRLLEVSFVFYMLILGSM